MMTILNLAPVDTNQRYSIPEAVIYLRTCRAKLYQQIKHGELKIIKDGGRTLIPGSEIVRKSTLQDAA